MVKHTNTQPMHDFSPRVAITNQRRFSPEPHFSFRGYPAEQRCMEVSLSGLHSGMWVAYFKTPGRPLRTQKYETFGPKLPLSVRRFSYADSTRQLLHSFHFCGDPVERP